MMAMNKSPESPWNPGEPTIVTPENYEKQVVDWLRASGQELEKFIVTHRKNINGPGGNYQFDAVAEFTGLCGAQFTILVECKRHSRPVEREAINTLYAKMREVEANKAMVFSASGFQSGAIKYATSKNIALVNFVEGSFLYQTRSVNSSGTSTPPSWANLPAYAGILMKFTNEGGISCTTIGMEKSDILDTWIQS